nr:apolipoL family protein [Helicobacter pylori]
MKELDRTIEGLVKKCEEQFSKDIKEDIEQFEERIKNFLVMLNHINLDSGFDFSFNIDSGINGLGLFASIGGLVILGLVNIWNPMGWIELGLVGFLGLVGVVKSVWNFFDSDYKKSQQRKEVDKNLDRFCEKITEDMRNQIENGKKGASEMIENLKDGLNDLVVCYERMREGLIKAGEDLWHLADRIKTTSKQGSHNE